MGDSATQLPPPPPGFVPPVLTSQPMGGAQQVVIIQQISFGHEPMNMTCPHCHAQVITQVEHETYGITYMWCCILCILGLNLGCCLAPFCCDCSRKAVHTCPGCKQFVGASAT